MRITTVVTLIALTFIISGCSAESGPSENHITNELKETFGPALDVTSLDYKTFESETKGQGRISISATLTFNDDVYVPETDHYTGEVFKTFRKKFRVIFEAHNLVRQYQQSRRVRLPEAYVLKYRKGEKRLFKEDLVYTETVNGYQFRLARLTFDGTCQLIDYKDCKTAMRLQDIQPDAVAVGSQKYKSLINDLFIFVQPIKSFTLTNHNGQRVQDTSFSGKMKIIYFGYTHCPDICPTILFRISEAVKALGNRSEQVVPIFITVDPVRDTASQLSQYLENFGKSFVGLTGSAEEIRTIANAYNV